MSKLKELIQKREALIHQSRLGREAIVLELDNLKTPINFADKTWSFISFVKDNPLVVMSVMSLFSQRFRKLSSILTGGHVILNMFRKSKS
jgi:hypothetical protein